MIQTIEQASASELLEAFISKYNDIVAENNALIEDGEELKAEAAKNADAAAKLAEAHSTLTQLITKHQALEKSAALGAVELARTKTALSLAQQAVQVYKQKDPDRMAAQIARLKESNETLTAKNNRLAGDNKNLTAWNAKRDKTIAEHEQTITALEKQLAFFKGSGIYHNGAHHLIVWPKKLSLQNADGSEYQCQGLLYMHQSGRGALVTYHNELGIQVAAAPAGGLKMAADCEKFASDWLFKVNVLQNGHVTDQDMMMADHNAEPGA